MDEENAIVLALFDVLGFEERLRSDGLRSLVAAYKQLATVVDQRRDCLMIIQVPQGENVTVPGIGTLEVQQDYFSDTIIFWAKYDFWRFQRFCDICAEFVCEVLELGMPIRGGIAVGEAHMNKSTKTYIGYPLVEAARVEKAQLWIGVSFGPSFTKTPFNQVFDPQTVLPYTHHRKPGYSDWIPGLVLDWPRKWRSSNRTPLDVHLGHLNRDRKHDIYYRNTFEFAEFSERQNDWYQKGSIST